MQTNGSCLDRQVRQYAQGRVLQFPLFPPPLDPFSRGCFYVERFRVGGWERGIGHGDHCTDLDTSKHAPICRLSALEAAFGKEEGPPTRRSRACRYRSATLSSLEIPFVAVLRCQKGLCHDFDVLVHMHQRTAEIAVGRRLETRSAKPDEMFRDGLDMV